ncbi:MAG: 6-bladed beta-propeller [Candidatus Aminicenantales bacterium]
MSKRGSVFGGLIIIYLLGIVVVAAAWTARPSAAAPGQIPQITLSPDLTIGVEEGDEKLMFGMVVRVDVDGRGNIYVLDYKFSRVGVFDSKGNLLRQIAVPEGQGPQETTGMPGIAVTPGGTMFINDTQKVIVYGPDGRYVRTFQVGFTITSIGCPGTEELVVLGPHDGKILHVFDAQGKLVASFGDTFVPPKKFESMKEMPMFGAPLRFSCAKDGHVFILNPHKYEVSVFKDWKLEGVIEGRSDAFKPIRKTGFGFASTVADIVSSGNLVFVAFMTMDPKAKMTADVFQAGRQIGSIDLPGTPLVADRQGMIYIAEQAVVPLGEEGFPKVIRYALIKN